MKSLIDNARSFAATHVADPRNTAAFEALRAGQSPEALFITCSDSRVVPALITGARPGELFELRTAGNVVPEYQAPLPQGEAATIEYAVSVLGVRDVVVCGHSHCGAVGALVRGEDLSSVPAVRDWLEHAVDPEGAVRTVAPATPDVAEAVQAHVLAQVERLRAYPCIARRIADGSLTLHAWYYEVHTGTVTAHAPTTGADLRPAGVRPAFVPL
ncbi:carbonic anhydrase [Streptomyces spiroverticillatus]|uniref:Carbonic anhydrase n=1 Tax=Streptomyces finlayi TaxID=67296 RepID=A0A918WWA3_9ACTN|nr:carbonic anhydrase [Streptomyces finlayi]GHA07098.1 carbonic anhydrase [Streptomyces spiroverticillatus]GHC90522.1 carbonic anhydrase [Streptomyces finlayi]